MIIDGKMRQLHKRSYCLTCRPYGDPNKSRLYLDTQTEKTCPKCKQTKPVDAFSVIRKNRRYSFCKECGSRQTRQRYRNFKKACVEYKGGKCERCGYSKCLWALDFHHKNPAEKLFMISSSPTRSLSASVMAEIDKCLLLCSNCHREEEAKPFD